MTREAIGNDDSMVAIAIKMAEGNPGAISVIRMILSAQPEMSGFQGIMVLLDLDDMNIRGSQIWVAYKDFACENIKTLIDAVQARDGRLVNYLNASKEDCGGHVAVERGGSFRRPARGSDPRRASTIFEKEIAR